MKGENDMAMQYIGARYVPIIYTNPDDGSANWKSGVEYEPLTVVVYDSDSYTSKKAVPVNIGAPADNPTYWVKTGDFNASLLALQREVQVIDNDINDETTGLKVRVTTAENDIDALESQNGDDELTTEAQTLSGAVNELNEDVDTINSTKKMFHSTSTGNYDNGTALSTILNSPYGDNARAEICSFVDGEHMASYPTRDCVGAYIECNSPDALTINNYSNLTIDSVTVPSDIDLTPYGDGSYIDIIDGTSHWTGEISTIVDNVITLKYGGFYLVNAGTPSLPTGGTLYINRITKIWGTNVNAILRANSPARLACGTEIGLRNDTSDGTMVAMLNGVLGTRHGGYIGVENVGMTESLRSVDCYDSDVRCIKKDELYASTQRVISAVVRDDSDNPTHGGSIDYDMNIRSIQNNIRFTKGNNDYFEIQENDIVSREENSTYHILRTVSEEKNNTTTSASGIVNFLYTDTNWHCFAVEVPSGYVAFPTKYASGQWAAKVYNVSDLSPATEVTINVTGRFLRKYPAT